MSEERQKNSIREIALLLGAVIVFAFVAITGMNAAQKYFLPLEIQVVITDSEGNVIESSPETQSLSAGEAVLGAFEEWFTFDDTENVTHFSNNVEIENDLIVNGLGGNILAGDSALLVSSANATKTCGVYREVNDTGSDIELRNITFNTFSASTTPTSTYYLMLGFASSTEASSSLARSDAYAPSSTRSLGRFTIATTNRDIWNNENDLGFGYATTWEEDWILCLSASGTQQSDDDSDEERPLCGGDTGGCTDASTTVNYGYFKWFGIEK